MTSPSNPFANVLAGTAPEAPARQGVLGSLLEGVWGKPGAIRQAEFEAAERQSLRKQQTAVEEGERGAQLEIMRLVESKRSELGDDVPVNAIFRAVVSDPTFSRHAMRFPAERMPKLLQDVITAASPIPDKPIAVPSGSALVDPKSLKEVYRNQPTVEDGRTKAEQTEVAKRAVGQLDKVIEAGQQARIDQLALEQLSTLGERIGTGGAAAIRGHLARFGIDLGDASDIQAFESLVDRLTPAQRQGLPGAASDRDVAMFKSALPSLIRQPDANRTIVGTLQAMAQDRIKRAEIAQLVFEGDLTVPQALREMRNLKDPLARFKESDVGKRLLSGATPNPSSFDAPAAPSAQPRARLRYNPQSGKLEPIQ